MTENGHPGDVDAHALGHVDVRVAERHEQGHGGLWPVDGSLTQIQVQIAEGAGGQGPLPQPERPAPRDMTEQGRGEARWLTARAGHGRGARGQVFLEARQFPADTGPEGGLDPFGEFVQRQAAREQVLAEHDHGLLALGVRNPDGLIVHSCHARPGLGGEAISQAPGPPGEKDLAPEFKKKKKKKKKKKLTLPGPDDLQVFLPGGADTPVTQLPADRPRDGGHDRRMGRDQGLRTLRRPGRGAGRPDRGRR